MAVTDLPEHQADGFVNQIVFVTDEQLGNRERIIEAVVSDEMLRRDHRDPPLPERLRFREPSQNGPIAIGEMRADDLRRGAVDEIPVIDPARVSQVQAMNRTADLRVTSGMLPHENEQRQQPLLVPRRLQ